MNIENIIEQLSGLTVVQAIDLSKRLEQIWGVSAAVAVAAPQAADTAQAAEKTEFDVVMTSVGGSKLGVIKVVREITGLGLKEAKDLVDGALPVKIKESVSKDEANTLAAKLKESGATVEVK